MQATMKRGDFDRACERAIAYANRKQGGLELAEQFLERAGFGGELFGIESVSCGERELRYLNVGDTYSLTIGQEGDGEVFSTSWGGWLEEAEQEHCEENGETRCGYCGEFTPVAEDWHDTVCQHCGRYVDSGELPDKGQEKMEPENLDAMDPEDLHAYCQEQSNPAPLREYAAIRARAIDARKAGRIQQALQWEQSLDRLYQQLPEDLQW